MFQLQVDLSDLPLNIMQFETEPQLLFDGRMFLTTNQKHSQKKIEDLSSILSYLSIVTWKEAFSIYDMILTFYFSQRWKDLSQHEASF